MNDLRKQNELLRTDLEKSQRSIQPRLPDLAGLDEDVTVSGRHWRNDYHTEWSITLTWREIFALIAPYLHQHPIDQLVASKLATSLNELLVNPGRTPTIRDQDFQTLRVQLSALRLVSATYTKTTAGGMGLFWSLTPSGESLLLETRAIRTAKAKP